MLKELLDQKKCFKLICGAGNENLDEVEKLVALYAAAGCRFFDLSANEEVLKAAQRGLDFSIPKEQQKDYHFCISIGTKNDAHVQKAQIHFELCKKCEQCIKNCPQNAINQYFKVIKDNCIGCLKCKSVCMHNSIEVYSEAKPFNLPTFQPFNLDCIELHASDTDEKEVDEIWSDLQNFGGMLSLCLGREKLSTEQILSRIKRLINDRAPYTTIIQADGSPMSGGEDDFKTTLQAVAMAEVIQNANLPVYVLLSGGTNSKTSEFARLCGVEFNGIAFGSYARKMVKKYIERKDFYENKSVFDEACFQVKMLIN